MIFLSILDEIHHQKLSQKFNFQSFISKDFYQKFEKILVTTVIKLQEIEYFIHFKLELQLFINAKYLLIILNAYTF